MDETATKYLRILGIVFLVLANGLLSLPKKDENPRALTAECVEYLYNADDFDHPPVNCIEELFYLKLRIERRLKEYKDAHDLSDVPVPDNKSKNKN